MVFDRLFYHLKLLFFAFLHLQLPAPSRFLPFSCSTSFACSIVVNPPEGTEALVIVIRGPSFFHPILKSACNTITGKAETAQQSSLFWLGAHRCVYDFGSRSFLPNRAFLVKRVLRTEAVLQPWTVMSTNSGEKPPTTSADFNARHMLHFRHIWHQSDWQALCFSWDFSEGKSVWVFLLSPLCAESPKLGAKKGKKQSARETRPQAPEWEHTV